MSFSTMKADSFEIIKLNETKLNLIKLNNLSIKSTLEMYSDMPVKYFPGKTFISIFHFHFHHFVLDTLCQYEYIKSYVPDINIEFINPFGIPTWRGADPTDMSPENFLNFLKTVHFAQSTSVIDTGVEQHKYFEDIFTIYNSENNKGIYCKESDNLLFESVYFIVDDAFFFNKQMLMDVGLTGEEIPWLSEDWQISSGSELFEKWGKLDWEDPAIILGSKKVQNYLYKTESYPKKIYVSRIAANNRYKEEMKLNFDFNQKNYEERVFEREEEIEKYFTDRGYKSVTLEGTPLLFQLLLFHNATHIASLSGSGLVNMLGCSKDAKIIEIRALKKFGYAYARYATTLGIPHIYIDIRNTDFDNTTIEQEFSKYEDDIQN